VGVAGVAVAGPPGLAARSLPEGCEAGGFASAGRAVVRAGGAGRAAVGARAGARGPGVAHGAGPGQGAEAGRSALTREFRPRDGREVVRRSAEPDTAPVTAGALPEERSPGRVEKGRIAADVAEAGVLGLGSVRGLRRLVVAREVLGPPLALRGEEPY